MNNICKSDITGLPLKSYSETEAIHEVCNAWGTRKKALMRYKCSKCQTWHIMDEDTSRKILNQNCTRCYSSSKKLKQTYNNSNEASIAGGKLTKNLGIYHRTYPCPYGFGWHVTSEEQKKYRYNIDITQDSIKNNRDDEPKATELKSRPKNSNSNMKEWTKTTNGLINNKNGIFVSFSITLRDLVPVPGYTVNSHLVKFIRDSDIENP